MLGVGSRCWVLCLCYSGLVRLIFVVNATSCDGWNMIALIILQRLNDDINLVKPLGHEKQTDSYAWLQVASSVTNEQRRWRLVSPNIPENASIVPGRTTRRTIANIPKFDHILN